MEKTVICMWENNKKILYLFAIAVMLVMFIGVMGVCAVLGIDNIDAAHLFNIGYLIIAMLLSFVLFICCILDGIQNDSDRGTFLLLIFFDFFALAFSILFYYLEGIPKYRKAEIIIVALVFSLDYVIYYLILKYQTMILDIRNERAAGIVLKMFRCIAFFLCIVAFVNIFTPIYFEIDAMGDYYHAAFYFVNSSFRVVIPLAGFVLLLAYRRQIKPYQIIAIVGYDIVTVILVFFEHFTAFYLDYGVILLQLFVFYRILNVENGYKGAVTERELAIAKRIQAGLLPHITPDYVDEFEIYAQMTPAKDMCGDFYDFFMLDDTHFAFLLGDVSAHNVGGALFMAISKAMLNMGSQLSDTPAYVLNDVNKRIINSDYNNMYVNVWMAFLDIATGHLVYSGAGIPRIAVQDQEVDGVFRYESLPYTPALGVTEEYIYRNMEVDIIPGDRVFLFSNGIISSGRGNAYGYDRLLAFLNENMDKDNEALCNALKSSIFDFYGERHRDVDVTMLCITYKQPMGKEVQA